MSFSKPVAAVIQCTYSDLWQTHAADDYCIEAAKSSGLFDRIILAAPDLPQNAVFHTLAKDWGVELFLGAQFNVAQRLMDAAAFAGTEILARMLLIRFYMDVELVAGMIEALLADDADFVSLPRDFNYEMAADVLTVRGLRRVLQSLDGDDYTTSAYRFAPWSFIENNPQQFRIVRYDDVPVYAKCRVDAIKSKYKSIMTYESSVYGQNFPASGYRFVSAFLHAGDNVLDIACGSGEGTRMLSKRCRYITGVDYHQGRPADADNMHFLCADAQHYEQPEAYNVVVSMHTMEHLPDDHAFLYHMFRSLKPGGRLILEVPLLLPRPLGEPLLPNHIREYRIQDLKLMLIAQEFRVHKIWGGNRYIYTSEDNAREFVQIHAVKS